MAQTVKSLADTHLQFKSSQFKIILYEIVKIILLNLDLDYKSFKYLYDKVDSMHTGLLLYTEVGELFPADAWGGPCCELYCHLYHEHQC